MSNFEPNAVIRGFQLTIVGSMSSYVFSLEHTGDWVKIPWRIPGYTRNSINVVGVGHAKTLIKVLVLHLASHLMSFALE